ncbi:slipin family protein [Burkholderia sp. LMG 32019]|uniref:slipin family protein n=1 Tax=Burkholderia sp. LMG 32019 TaxID=3158173 RepID=UPI003C2F216F
MFIFICFAVVAVIVAFILVCVKVVGQFERGVVLTFGKVTRVVNPGLNVLIPGAQVMMRADMRVTALEIPAQDVITSDNVSVKVAAITYFKVEDARKALLDVQNYGSAVGQLAQITLRSTIGRHTLDELLSHQDKLNTTLGQSIEERSTQWGIHVDHVEIRSVDLDASMIRAMAQEAEAERGRRARVITAEGEYEAAQKLSEAADILAKNPAALTLRTLATLREIGVERNSVIIFPVSQEHLMGPQVASSALAKAVADHVGRAEPLAAQ